MDDPTSGSVGGISRVSKHMVEETRYLITLQKAVMQLPVTSRRYEYLWRRCERNADQPDSHPMDDLYYGCYETSLQTIHRITTDTSADAGFTSLMYKGKKVYYDSNALQNHMYSD